MTFQVIIQERAFEDLERCYQFLAANGPEYQSDDWYEKVIAAIYLLEQDALKWGFTTNAQLAELKLRELYIKWHGSGYRVFYSVEGHAVRVLAISHAFENSLDSDEIV